jgi:hypothetical protein
MSDSPFKPPLSPDVTLLDEIAMAINERGFRREPGECSWPYLKPEMKALVDLIQQHAKEGDTSPKTMIDFTAMLILDGMVAQNLCDLRLAARSLPPFNGNPLRGDSP